MNLTKLPHSIVRQLRRISFKSKEALINHARTLLASWRYSADRRAAAKSNARAWVRYGKAMLQQRHAEHAETCRQAYMAKISLVEAGKGRNSIGGIPA